MHKICEISYDTDLKACLKGTISIRDIEVKFEILKSNFVIFLFLYSVYVYQAWTSFGPPTLPLRPTYPRPFSEKVNNTNNEQEHLPLVL
jgi:hypothetical protein